MEHRHPRRPSTAGERLDQRWRMGVGTTIVVVLSGLLAWGGHTSAFGAKGAALYGFIPFVAGTMGGSFAPPRDRWTRRAMAIAGALGSILVWLTLAPYLEI